MAEHLTARLPLGPALVARGGMWLCIVSHGLMGESPP